MSTNTDPDQVIKTWFYRLFKIGLFVVVILSFYMIYLDAWVQKRMSGPKWETPIKVYARPLVLFPNKFIPQAEFIAELRLLGYRAVETVQAAGQFSVSADLVEVYRRQYIHTNGLVSPQRLRVSFNGQRVQQTEEYSEQGWLINNGISIEPLFISRHSQDSTEDRDIVDIATLPEWMVDALLVVEDKNFYHHHGVAPLAILRALVANIQAGRKVQGGSTLTQQLAKNMLLNDSRKTYTRKIKEALVALILDYRFSKDAILEAYFNEVYLGQNGARSVHGFGLASRFYFNKPLAELQQHEFALLVGMVKGPSYYNPNKRPKRAKSRRDLVLQLMVSENVMDRFQYQHYVSLPMKVVEQKSNSSSLFPSYMQLVERELKALELDVGDEGLILFTGLDPLLQSKYQTLFSQSIASLEQRYKQQNINGAVVSVDLNSASVSALVGDKDPNSYGFNRALDANRNIGSLIKPAVYLTALQQAQYHLGTVLADTPIKMKNNKGKAWQPENYSKSHQGQMLLIDALSNSVNLPTVHLGMELGLSNVIKTITELGEQQDIAKYPSVLLGAVAMSPLQVAKMYQPIAEYGMKSNVSAIIDITDMSGILIWSKSNQARQLFEYATGYELGHALQKVTQTGTAKRLGKFYQKTHYAGKTGTTDDLRDSWFVGFDQNKVTSVWIGKDDNSTVNLTGSQGALSVFIKLQQARQAESLNKLPPNEIELRFIDPKTGNILSDDCGESISVPISKYKIKNIVDCPSIFDWFN